MNRPIVVAYVRKAARIGTSTRQVLVKVRAAVTMDNKHEDRRNGTTKICKNRKLLTVSHVTEKSRSAPLGSVLSCGCTVPVLPSSPFIDHAVVISVGRKL